MHASASLYAARASRNLFSVFWCNLSCQHCERPAEYEFFTRITPRQSATVRVSRPNCCVCTHHFTTISHPVDSRRMSMLLACSRLRRRIPASALNGRLCRDSNQRHIARPYVGTPFQPPGPNGHVRFFSICRPGRALLRGFRGTSNKNIAYEYIFPPSFSRR